MATTKRLFVFVTCVLSGIGAIVIIISLVTEQWVVTDSARWISTTNVDPNTIQYGLFQGIYHQIYPTSDTLQLSMTCLVRENVCAFLCAANSADRYSLLKALVNGQNASQDDINCPRVSSSRTYVNKFHYLSTKLRNIPSNQGTKKFINCGVWISTVVFLAISLLFGVTSSALAVYNTVYNPIEVYLGIFGLYVTNAIALCSLVLVMSLWGIMHIIITYHNVAIFYTLNGSMTSDKVASLGFSYWINLIPIICYQANILLLYIRQYLISKDPGQKIIERDDRADPGILLY